jgi:hypothetical protein
MAWRAQVVDEFLAYVDEDLAAAAVDDIFAPSPEGRKAAVRFEPPSGDAATKYWAAVLAQRLFKSRG